MFLFANNLQIVFISTHQNARSMFNDK